VEHYNDVRLNGAIGYITTKVLLAGPQQEIQDDRDRKLEVAREQRKNRRLAAIPTDCRPPSSPSISEGQRL
jgi:putative transposase